MYCGKEFNISSSNNKNIMVNELKQITGYDNKTNQNGLVCGYAFNNCDVIYTCMYRLLFLLLIFWSF